jgi:hypothetical protein
LRDNHYEGIARPRPAPVTLPERPRTYEKRLKRKAPETSDRDDERARKRTATPASDRGRPGTETPERGEGIREARAQREEDA